MPRGFTAKQYIGLVAISFSSMMLGGSCVHAYYKPDLTLPEDPNAALANAPRTDKKIALVAPRGHRPDDESKADSA